VLCLITRNLLDRKEGALLLVIYSAYTAWLVLAYRSGRVCYRRPGPDRKTGKAGLLTLS